LFNNEHFHTRLLSNFAHMWKNNKHKKLIIQNITQVNDNLSMIQITIRLSIRHRYGVVLKEEILQ